MKLTKQRNIFGFYRAVVKSSLGDGRIRIFIPQLYDDADAEQKYENAWPIAEPALPIQHHNGNLAVPEVNSTVWVFFENGNIATPVYFAICPGADNWKEDVDAIGAKVNAAVSGQYTEANKRPLDNMTLLSDGHAFLMFHHGSEWMALGHDGSVICFSKNNEITIKNNQGKINISGSSDINISGSSKISISGGTFDISSTGQGDIESGTILNISSTGNLNITTQGILTLTGAQVVINETG